VADLKERWLPIIPTEWPLCRDAKEQAASVLEKIDDYLSQFKEKKFRPLYPLLDSVQDMRADNDFNKEETLARLWILRGRLHPTLLSKIATLIQTEFVRAGADFNNNAVIYPGKSALCLNNPHFEPLPFDKSTLANVKKHTKSVGFDLDDLINLPEPRDLLEIAQTPQWLKIRKALLSDTINVEIQQEIRSIFTSYLTFPNKMEKLLNISDHIFMPSPWALVSQSLLGNFSVAAKNEEKIAGTTFILYLDTYVLSDKNSQVKFTQQETKLLSILVIAGKLGLTIELMKQWLIELDTLKEEEMKWESQAELNPERDDIFFTLRNRIDKLKGNINKKLKPLGLGIGGEKGKERWYLESDNIKLSSTAWGEIFEKKEKKYTPKGLSPQSKKIWDCLWEYSPTFVHADILADILETEKTPKEISKIIYKLNEQIKDEPWMIKPSYSGEYALVRKQID